MGRKKREEEWTQEDWNEWYHQQIEKLARSLIPKMKTILKKMESQQVAQSKLWKI
jgi:hypothetical protein